MISIMIFLAYKGFSLFGEYLAPAITSIDKSKGFAKENLDLSFYSHQSSAS